MIEEDKEENNREMPSFRRDREETDLKDGLINGV